MFGNVGEWVQDCYHKNYEGAPADGRAWEERECSQRVIRGGSWLGAPVGVRSANRAGVGLGLRDSALGFRLAQDL
jgi:formylglycine-generating enzyme required for sulfatase activity